MKLHTVLLRHAVRLASSQAVRRVELSAEIGRREARTMSAEQALELEAIKADADNCGQAFHRFGKYRPDKEASCPFCWIVHGERFPVEPTARPEIYGCAKCEAEYSLMLEHVREERTGRQM